MLQASLSNKKSEYGHGFDCVDIHKQPGLDHPLLMYHNKQKFSPGSRMPPIWDIPYPRRSISEEKIGIKEGPEDGHHFDDADGLWLWLLKLTVFLWVIHQHGECERCLTWVGEAKFMSLWWTHLMN